MIRRAQSSALLDQGGFAIVVCDLKQRWSTDWDLDDARTAVETFIGDYTELPDVSLEDQDETLISTNAIRAASWAGMCQLIHHFEEEAAAQRRLIDASNRQYAHRECRVESLTEQVEILKAKLQEVNRTWQARMMELEQEHKEELDALREVPNGMQDRHFPTLMRSDSSADDELWIGRKDDIHKPAERIFEAPNRPIGPCPRCLDEEFPSSAVIRSIIDQGIQNAFSRLTQQDENATENNITTRHGETVENEKRPAFEIHKHKHSHAHYHYYSEDHIVDESNQLLSPSQAASHQAHQGAQLPRHQSAASRVSRPPHLHRMGSGLVASVTPGIVALLTNTNTEEKRPKSLRSESTSRPVIPRPPLNTKNSLETILQYDVSSPDLVTSGDQESLKDGDLFIERQKENNVQDVSHRGRVTSIKPVEEKAEGTPRTKERKERIGIASMAVEAATPPSAPLPPTVKIPVGLVASSGYHLKAPAHSEVKLPDGKVVKTRETRRGSVVISNQFESSR